MNPSILAAIAQAHRGGGGGGGGGGPSDPYWGNVVSLLPFDGANGSTTFTDQVSGRVWTPNGSAQISTARSKFGGASGLFANATSDGIVCNADASLAIGTADFTIELFVFISSTATATIFDNRFGSYGATLVLYNNSSTPTTWYLYANSGNRVTFTMSTGAWHHLAICRVSGTTRVFLDGVSQGSWADTSNYNQQQFSLGRRYSGSNQSINGNLDEFRFTNGVGRYAADFTPPAAAFPTH